MPGVGSQLHPRLSDKLPWWMAEIFASTSVRPAAMPELRAHLVCCSAQLSVAIVLEVLPLREPSAPQPQPSDWVGLPGVGVAQAPCLRIIRWLLDCCAGRKTVGIEIVSCSIEYAIVFSIEGLAKRAKQGVSTNHPR